MEAFLESDPNNDEFEDEEIEVQIQDYDGWLKGATNPSKRDKYQKGLNILIERKSLIERKIQMTPNLRDQLIELERQFAAKGIIISLQSIVLRLEKDSSAVSQKTASETIEKLEYNLAHVNELMEKEQLQTYDDKEIMEELNYLITQMHKLDRRVFKNTIAMKEKSFGQLRDLKKLVSHVESNYC